MASSKPALVIVPQGTKRTHAEMSSSEISSQQNLHAQSSVNVEKQGRMTPEVESNVIEAKDTSTSKDTVKKSQNSDPSHACNDSRGKKIATVTPFVATVSEDGEAIKQSQKSCSAAKAEIFSDAINPADETSSVERKLISYGTTEKKPSLVNSLNNKGTTSIVEEHVPTSKALAPSSHLASESRIIGAHGPAKSTPEPMETSVATASQDTTAKPSMETAASQSKSTSHMSNSTNLSNSKPQLEDGEEPEKNVKLVSTSNNNKDVQKTPEQVLELMDKTFEQRRKIVTKQMPTIPELKEMYPDLFTGKQLLLEFQRITKIDIDQKIQEFCVRYAIAVIELAKNKKGAAPVLARWEQAKQENDALRQYWDMVTALCLLPLHFGENFVEMVLEIGEDEEVVPQGKIVPTLVARGNIFCTDEFFLIAENTIVQEFEEFTIAFASLYCSYWVFNMVYPETIENTYNYIQRCIVRQREPGAVPTSCKNFTKTLLKWKKEKMESKSSRQK